VNEQVLVVLDGADLAHLARHALRRVCPIGSPCPVEVLHVLDDWRAATEGRPGRLAERLEQAWSYVREQADKLSLPGMEPKASLVLGSIDQTLAGRIEQNSVRDLARQLRSKVQPRPAAIAADRLKEELM